jgi:uncharacterized membrane protein YozB (DUF420 family)
MPSGENNGENNGENRNSVNVLLAQAHPLVHLNAGLNGLATVLLVIGWIFIRRGREQAHARVMLTAFFVSCLFLASYLTYHALEGSVKFTHSGVVRTIYLVILASHVLLAMTVPFLALFTIRYGLKATGWCLGGRASEASELQASEVAKYRLKHRRFARWTFPIWLYVSITGVVVYLMLYHLYPSA